MLSSGTMIYAESPADEAAIASARKFIADRKLVSDDVRITKRGNSICVITKKEIDYGKS